MKLIKFSLILSFLSFLPPAFAAKAAPVDNKTIVTEFYDMAFNQHRPREAAMKYIGDEYIQHNPMVPNGAKPFYTYFEKHFIDNPESKAIIHRAIADGDLVALHVESKESNKDRGVAIVDIFRVKNGKIVEHWDVIQPIPEKTSNGNTMFQGKNNK